MKIYESTGKNIEQAINVGLVAIGKNRSEVNIKIVDAGGIFKKAKVVLEYEEDVVQIIEEKVEVEVILEDTDLKKDILSKFDNLSEKTANSTNNFQDLVNEEKLDSDIFDIENKTQEFINDMKKEQEQNIENHKNIIQTIDNKNNKIETNVKIDANIENMIDSFFNSFCSNFDIEYNKKISTRGNTILIDINGNGVGKMIGFRGETLSALQIILNAMLININKDKRILLDIESYKLKRENTLKELSKRLSKKVIATGNSEELEPMNSYERKIIHETIQDLEGIYTESTGEGKFRHIIIKKQK